MKKVEELKKDLRLGDYGLLQEMTGVKKNTIDKYFQGYRNADTPKGRIVLVAAEKLIESRKQLLATRNADEHGGTPSMQ
ncbi:hypothetical protein [Pontibacter beigongshangensis]|uniref:hypothetical protein n=1 Tax=Pontibacter beigongshangensis TaxID=2574733 RepID=UPI001650C5B6|nr:hypothetical protein [Pontibacter beigongshangensis]